MKPLSLIEQEYRKSLYRIERRAIIPIKWGILFVSILLWLFVIELPLGPGLFGLLLAYTLHLLAHTYFFFFSTVTNRQIRPFTLVSYLADVVFVTMLIYFDLTTITARAETHSDFYVIYFLLVMRGFALFKTLAETVFVNVMISVLYILTFYLQHTDLSFIFNPRFSVSLLLIWLVILMSWFIIMVINRQKMELVEMNERLLRADALTRVGELAAGVAHEINNPIGIIVATAEYLKKQVPPEDPRFEDVEAIHLEALRCKDIVQEMLAYARPKPANMAVIDPCVLNDEVLAFVLPISRRERCDVEREYDPNAGMIEADANLIKQALLNLYLNATQAIPKDRPGRIIARIEKAGHSVRFEVEDNGTGIAEDDLEHIFDPFFTRKTNGTGLGLAITQRIVEQFQGTIAVTSEFGKGTTFTLEFPTIKT